MTVSTEVPVWCDFINTINMELWIAEYLFRMTHTVHIRCWFFCHYGSYCVLDSAMFGDHILNSTLLIVLSYDSWWDICSQKSSCSERSALRACSARDPSVLSIQPSKFTSSSWTCHHCCQGRLHSRDHVLDSSYCQSLTRQPLITQDLYVCCKINYWTLLYT